LVSETKGDVTYGIQPLSFFNKRENKVNKLIEKYQCPGCVCGSNTRCGKFIKDDGYGECCISHVPGTSICFCGSFYLGLPKGMNKVGDFNNSYSRFRIWREGTKPEWDAFNIPVWVKQDGSNLIVKTVLPRTMRIFIDIIENSDKSVIVFEKSSIDGLESDFFMTPFDITNREDID